MTGRRLLVAAAAALAGGLVGLLAVPAAARLTRHLLEHPDAAAWPAAIVLAAAAVLVTIPTRR